MTRKSTHLLHILTICEMRPFFVLFLFRLLVIEKDTSRKATYFVRFCEADNFMRYCEFWIFKAWSVSNAYLHFFSWGKTSNFKVELIIRIEGKYNLRWRQCQDSRGFAKCSISKVGSYLRPSWILWALWYLTNPNKLPTILFGFTITLWAQRHRRERGLLHMNVSLIHPTRKPLK